MDKSVFISKVKLVPDGKLYRLKFKIFDKDGEVGYFLTSLMTRYNAEKYEEKALDLIDSKSWFKTIYGIFPHEFTLITECKEKDNIVGLSYAGGLLLKNEVKKY